jgi:hypothetical protein
MRYEPYGCRPTDVAVCVPSLTVSVTAAICEEYWAGSAVLRSFLLD